jgi:hypothetical protein
MSNFVKDSPSPLLPATKLDIPAPVGLDSGYVTGGDVNKVAQALLDLRSELRAVSFNVKHYGAIGDGVTNDTTAVQAAADAAEAAGGGTVFFPPGTYLVNGVDLPTKVRFLGSGWASTLKLAASQSRAVVKLKSPEVIQAGIEQLDIDGNRTAQSSSSAHGIHFVTTGTTTYADGGGKQLYLKDVRVRYTKGHGIYVPDASGTSGTQMHRVVVFMAALDGFNLRVADANFFGLVSGRSGRNGFYLDSTNTRLVLSKAWNSGWAEGWVEATGNTTYAGGTTYASGDYVYYQGSVYKSMQAANTGHTPGAAGSEPWWTPSYWVDGTAAWSVGTTYAAGAYVTRNGGAFRSLQAANTGNDPATASSTWWAPAYSVPGEGDGFYITDWRISLIGCESQDNFGSGYVMDAIPRGSCGNATFEGTLSDSNGDAAYWLRGAFAANLTNARSTNRTKLSYEEKMGSRYALRLSDSALKNFLSVDSRDAGAPVLVGHVDDDGTSSNTDSRINTQEAFLGTASTSFTPTLDAGRFKWTLSGNSTLNNPAVTDRILGRHLEFVILQDATGGRTLTLGTDYRTINWELNTAANSVNTLSFMWDGTKWTQIAGSRKDRSAVDGWSYATPAASMTTAQMSRGSITGHAWLAPRAGNISAITQWASAALTGGSAVVRLYRSTDGGASYADMGLTCTLNSGSRSTVSGPSLGGANTAFAQGDLIRPQLDTAVGYAPASTLTHFAGFEVAF